MTGHSPPPELRRTFRVVQWVVRLVFRMLYRIRAEGIENIPLTGGVVIASNHASFVDPPGIGCVFPREISFFAKKELFSIPVFREFLVWANGVPVDRTGDSSRALMEMIKRLKGGWAVLVFPEGTRTKTGEFLEPRSGAGMAAVSAGVPVVPCWVEGSFRPRMFRSRIVFHFLPPFRPEDVPAESRKEQYSLVSKKIMCDIRRLYDSRPDRRSESGFHAL